MANNSFHNNPQYMEEERFVRLEEKFIEISHNMFLLVEALASNLGPFKEIGSSNSEIRSKGKSRDNQDLEKESGKEPEKEKSSFSSINLSQSLLNMEVKVDIKTYQGEIDALKLNHWLQQLEFYFRIDHRDEEKNISFSGLKLEGHALT
jgi:hypothetical protein